jgi:hypothetical protein
MNSIKCIYDYTQQSLSGSVVKDTSWFISVTINWPTRLTVSCMTTTIPTIGISSTTIPYSLIAFWNLAYKHWNDAQYRWNSLKYKYIHVRWVINLLLFIEHIMCHLTFNLLTWGHEGYCTLHYPSCTDSINPSLQFSCNFASEGSPFPDISYMNFSSIDF